MIFDDDAKIIRLLTDRLKLLPTWKNTQIFSTTLRIAALEFVDKHPQLAFVDVHSPEYEDGFAVIDALRSNSKDTFCILMTHTGDNNIQWIVEAWRRGVMFINKDLLVLPDSYLDLGDFILRALNPHLDSWERSLNKLVAENLTEVWKEQKRYSPLPQNKTIGFAPLFAPREEEFLRVLTKNPSRKFSEKAIAQEMNIAEESVRDYRKKLAKTLLTELEWYENGQLTREGQNELSTRGFIEPNQNKPELSLELIICLLRVIGWIPS